MLGSSAGDGLTTDGNTGDGFRGRKGRIWLRLVGGLAAACVLAALGFGVLARQQALRQALPVTNGSLRVAGLSAAAQVVRDRHGVPHVRAASERDAWWALGFVHAQDRLEQMLWLRRLAEGRSAERLGPEGVPADRLARTLDLEALAAADLAHSSNRTRRVLAAYAAGVNARMARLSPAGAATLGETEIAPWRGVDSLALLKLHAWALGGSLDELLVLDQITRRLGGSGAQPFFPAGVGGGARGHRDTLAAGGAPLELPVFEGAKQAPLRRLLGLRGRGIGSSAFAVSGRRARKGRPLLAADAHFEARFPAHFYEAELRGGPLEVAGATLPGIPAFWVGFTPRLAWAATHYPALVADLATVTLQGKGAARYRSGRGWRPLELREETLRVRGKKSQLLQVRRTRRGPLVQDLLPLAAEPVELRWIGAQPADTLAGLLGLLGARDVAEARKALERHREPVLAMVLVDAAGAGGLQVAGAIPERQLPSGAVPVPGDDPAYRWTRPLPSRVLPQMALGPRRPFAVAADGSLGGPRRGIELLWRPGDREQRILALLRERARRAPLDLDDLAEIQTDIHASSAGKLIRAALALAGKRGGWPREAREVARILEGWDQASAAGSRGAAAFHVFQAQLLRRVLEPALGEALLTDYLQLPRVRSERVLLKILAAGLAGGAPDAPWTEPARLSQAVRHSLRDTWITLSVELGANREKWSWGRLHPLRFELLRGLPEAWRPGGLGPFPYSGDGDSVQLAAYRPLSGFAAQVVAPYRMVLEAGNLDQALSVLAPGQSGHPGDAHATDQLPAWLEGRLSLLSTRDRVIEDGEVARLRLEPAP